MKRINLKSGILLLPLIFLLILSGCSKDEKEIDLRIAIPFSSDLKNENFEKIVQQLEDAGFTNVETLKIDDLIFGLFTDDGEVEAVTINGDEEFLKGDKFDKELKITVSYHTFPEKVVEEVVEETEEPEKVVEVEEPEKVVEVEEPVEDFTEINQLIKEDLLLSQGWALGKLDRDGKPTKNGTPVDTFAFSLFVQEITYLGDKLRVSVDPSFNQLSDEEKTYIGNTVQNLVSVYSENIRYTTFFINGNAIGHSKITNVKSFTWD